MRALYGILALTLMVTAACASTGSTDGGRDNRAQMNRITAEEIDESAAQNALQLLQDMRPGWRGTVYLDGFRLGPLSELASIPLSTVQSMEYLEPIDAAARFGLEHQGGGAIIVKTR